MLSQAEQLSIWPGGPSQITPAVWIGTHEHPVFASRIGVLGVKAIVNLAREHVPDPITLSGLKAAGLRWYGFFPLEDFGRKSSDHANSNDALTTVIAYSAILVKLGIPTLFHCAAGKSRSPLVAAGALATALFAPEKSEFEKTLALLSKRRTALAPHPELKLDVMQALEQADEKLKNLMEVVALIDRAEPKNAKSDLNSRLAVKIFDQIYYELVSDYLKCRVERRNPTNGKSLPRELIFDPQMLSEKYNLSLRT